MHHTVRLVLLVLVVVVAGSAPAVTTALAPALSADLSTTPSPDLSAGPGTAPPPLVAPDEPLRVLAIGDSMTQGHAGSATWRYWLWRELVRQGVPARMVGPTSELAGGGGYARRDHGFSGQTRHAARRGTGLSDHLPGIEHLMTRSRPDVVVVQLGFNDAPERTAQQIARETLALLEGVRRGSPQALLVLAEIPSRTTRVQGRPSPRLARKNAVTAEVNQLLAPTLARWSGVAVSHLREAYRPRLHTFDGVHPDAVGETVLAQAHAEALQALGVLPETPRVYRPAATWHARPVPDRVLVAPAGPGCRGGHCRRHPVDVEWAAAAAAHHADGVRVRITDPSRGTTTWAEAGHGAVPAVRAWLRPGTHRVQLQVLRGSMTSPLGPAVRVHVPPVLSRRS